MNNRQLPTTFTPAPIPTGIETIAGNEYMRDSRGALLSVASVKPADKLQDEMVRKVLGFALGLSGQVARFKEHTLGDVLAFDQLLEQQYQVVKRGNRPEGKGNRTYMSYDGLFRVSIQVADSIDFGPELQIAKALLDECMIEFTADARPEIRSIITRAFNTAQEGKVNRSDIFMLLRIESEDERWNRAMEAIRAAMRVVSRKEYIRFGMRSDAKADWTSVTIDLAQA